MADVAKLKKTSRLGAPPSVAEASTNLSAPEVAPVAPVTAPASVGEPQPYRRRDARSMRKTNRTLPFATRVSQEFDERFRTVAERDGLKLAELMEKSLEAYEMQHG